MVITELRDTAAGRDDLLAEAAGLWVGFREHDPWSQPLIHALLNLPGVDPWVQVGRERASHPAPDTSFGR